MASIRRPLSPQRDRMHRNGSNLQGSFQTPANKRPKNSQVRRFPADFLLLTHCPRKGSRLNRSLFSCLVFFLFGILLGMAPFGNDYIIDLRNRDLGNAGVSAAANSSELNLNVGSELGVSRETNKSESKQMQDFLTEKLLIVVTPTYNRALQAYYLNRLGQVLRLLRPPVLWIVVEMNAASIETADILRNIGVLHRHLACKKTSARVKDRGVHQRNTALEHIEMHKLDGIVYFADDDNIYSLDLFESMRNISRFGTWPVGMMAQSKNKATLEGPVCSGNQVIGWHTNEKSKRLRRFHVDMSGFAFNSTILWDAKRWRRPSFAPIRQLDTVKEGFQETTFIEQIVEDEGQMEGVPQGCSRIMNWHLHLEVPRSVYPRGWLLQQNLDASG